MASDIFKTKHKKSRQRSVNRNSQHKLCPGAEVPAHQQVWGSQSVFASQENGLCAGAEENLEFPFPIAQCPPTASPSHGTQGVLIPPSQRQQWNHRLHYLSVTLRQQDKSQGDRAISEWGCS